MDSNKIDSNKDNLNRRGEPFLNDMSNVDIELSSSKNQVNLKKKKSLFKILMWTILGLIVVAVIAAVSVYLYYKDSLKAVNPNTKQVIQFEVNKGDTMNSLAVKLKSKNLIKDKNTFKFYVSRNKESKVVPGFYHFNQSMDVENIVKDIREGNVAEFNLTFKPGQDIFDVKKILKNVGYKDKDIMAALNASYAKYPYVKSRGDQKSLEGLIFPDTYRVEVDYTATNALTRPISHMQEYINKNNIEQKFNEHGLSLYQGLVLASILQKEAPVQDMPSIAGLFLNRLKKDIPLGADSTASYGAKVYNRETSTVVESIDIDTPYNTRIHKGLPPTPISIPSLKAIEATANPEDNDYLFFVSGDDGTTHYSKTNEEHEKNAKEYCKIRCQL